jgi:hypothetical protein
VRKLAITFATWVWLLFIHMSLENGCKFETALEMWFHGGNQVVTVANIRHSIQPESADYQLLIGSKT